MCTQASRTPRPGCLCAPRGDSRLLPVTVRLAPVQDRPEARSQAAALLPGRSLDGVAAAVGRALDFYATMGAFQPLA